MDDDVKLKECL